MKKIVELELDISTLRDTYTVNVAGILHKTMTVQDAERLLSPIETIFSASWDDSLPAENIEIGSLQVNNEQYLLVNSVAQLYLFNQAHYFDFTTQIHYISLPNWRNTLPEDLFRPGNTVGFLNQAQMVDINGIKYPLDIEQNGALYEPRLNDVSIEESIDNQQAGIFVYNELDASIINSDGTYDNLRGDVSGNNAKLYIADISDSPEEEIETGFPFKLRADPSDFKLVRQGVINDIDYGDPDNIAIIASDFRSDWQQSIGTNLFTVAEFPNLTDQYINTRKPICIGSVNGAHAIPLQDENAVAGNFAYLICDTSIGAIQSVSDVYFNGQLNTGQVDRYLTGGEYSVNLTTGVITVSNCLKGDVYVYGVFTEMDELVEVTTFLLSEYAGLLYLDNFFNLTEMNAIAALDYKVHVYINETGQELNSVIESLVMGAQIDFFQQGAVFTMRRTNEARVVTEEIEAYQLKSTPMPWNNSRGATFKTIEVLYNKDYRQDLFERYYDDSKETEAIDNNRKAEDKSIEVSLTNSSQIATIYDEFYSRFVKLPRTVTVDLQKPFTAGLTDFISFTLVRRTMGTEFAYNYTEELKAINDGTIKLIDTGEEKTVIIRGLKTKPISTIIDKEIFTKAKYKIVSINRLENTAEVEYFEDVLTETGVQATQDFIEQMTPSGDVQFYTVLGE